MVRQETRVRIHRAPRRGGHVRALLRAGEPDTSVLTDGGWATYDIVAGAKGPEAINVRPVPSNRHARPRAARYQPIWDRD